MHMHIYLSIYISITGFVLLLLLEKKDTSHFFVNRYHVKVKMHEIRM